MTPPTEAPRETRVEVKDGTVLTVDVLRWTEPTWDFDCPVCVLRPVVAFSPNGEEAEDMAYSLCERAADEGYLTSEGEDGIVDRAFPVKALKRRWAAARRGVEFPVLNYTASRFTARFYADADGLAFSLEESHV